MMVEPNLPTRLFGDEIRIRQIINNFLSNAVKYTKEGSITLSVDYESVSSRQIMLVVSVRDTGIGIKEEDLPKLYAAFERIFEKYPLSSIYFSQRVFSSLPLSLK